MATLKLQNGRFRSHIDPSMQVATRCTTPIYNAAPPYHPSMAYAEARTAFVSSGPNLAYALLRALFHDLGYDDKRYGTPAWNPLGHIIKPGQTVVIKPNFVLSYNASGSSLEAIITHPSILRAMVDYAFIALNGEGRIVIADAPQMDCCWADLMAFQRLDTIQDFYYGEFGFPVEVVDLRNFELIDNKLPGYPSNRHALAGDPQGSRIVNLGTRSQFYGLASENYYGADYDRSVTNSHHQGETQEYCVSRTILDSDVFISVPKMKVHKKVGVTLNLKGLVGINTNKNYLVHYRLGTPSTGGDQLPDGRPTSDNFVVRTQRWLMDRTLARESALGELVYKTAAGMYQHLIRRVAPVSKETRVTDAGNWFGNDSAWRMTADLAHIIHYCDRNGVVQSEPQRKFLSVIDGIVGGEDNGPLAATAKPVGALVVGENLHAADMVATRLMGFDARTLKQFAIGDKPFDAEAISVIRDGISLSGREFFDPFDRQPHLAFRPHPGWIGHIEMDRVSETSRQMAEAI
ncbi:MAG: DUF362 domain-containing protein [Candidatus Zixiibacteriota bacterium]